MAFFRIGVVYLSVICRLYWYFASATSADSSSRSSFRWDIRLVFSSSSTLILSSFLFYKICRCPKTVSFSYVYTFEFNANNHWPLIQQSDSFIHSMRECYVMRMWCDVMKKNKDLSSAICHRVKWWGKRMKRFYLTIFFFQM